jgi:hypothetical protein
MDSIYIALIPIIVALISGVFVVMNFIVTKDQKTSEFRQNWIDSLRDDVAEYIAINTVLFSRLVYSAQSNKISNNDISEFFKDNSSEFVKRDTARNRIYLRVNPEDDKEIIEAMQEIEQYWEGKKDFVHSSFAQCIDKLIQLMQKLLKKEWKRVKRGEVTYIIMKYIFVASIIILIVLVILLLNGKITLPSILNKATT